MTRRYEKFEEWMVGKKVIHDLDLNDVGVLLGDVEEEEGRVHVRYEKDGDCTAFIEYLNFLEGEEETPPGIPWEVGQEVWCLLRGKGVVNSVGVESVVIWFDRHGAYKYTSKGEHCGYEGVRSLFFSEPKVVAETMPAKKPFVPKLNEGDIVIVKHKRLEDKAILSVDREEEDAVWFKEEEDGYLKTAWNFFKVGEEVKWD